MIKKIFTTIIICLVTISLFGCNNANRKTTNSTKDKSVTNDTTVNRIATIPTTEQPTSLDSNFSEDSDEIDLTSLSSTMVYAEVYNMVNTPEKYIGKTVTMKGKTTRYINPDTSEIYYACIISDATACCSQGIEFVLENTDNYPQENDEITVSGTFEVYNEGEYKYIHLVNAELIQ